MGFECSPFITFRRQGPITSDSVKPFEPYWLGVGAAEWHFRNAFKFPSVWSTALQQRVWAPTSGWPGCVDSRVLDFALIWKRHQRRKRLLTRTKGHVTVDVFCYNSNFSRVGKRNFINLRANFVDESSRWVFKRICRLFSAKNIKIMSGTHTSDDANLCSS